MFNHIINKSFTFIKKLFYGNFNTFTDDNSYGTFFKTNIFLLNGVFLHCLYAAAFSALNLKGMVWVELLSVTVLVIASIINHKKVKYVPALMMCLEIGANGVLWAVMLDSGHSHYLLTFVALLALYLFLDLDKRYKVSITIYLLLCINIAHYADGSMPVVSSHNNIDWMAIITLNATFLMLTAELTINGIVTETIKRLHSKTVNEMADKAMRDPLTKLYNRRYFQENVEYIYENSKKIECCAAILDIDYFKKINDTYGHDFGDKVLLFFAEKMKSEFRSSDIIMRWGGEEFVIILNNVKLESAKRKLDIFRKVIQKSFIKHGDTNVMFTFTAGLCSVQKGMKISDAITTADKYLYKGKAIGRNCVVYK